MIGVMPGTLYVKIWAFMMLGYAAQMLLYQGNMFTDRRDIPSTPGMEFWIRGASIGRLHGVPAHEGRHRDGAPPPPAQAPSPRPQFSLC